MSTLDSAGQFFCPGPQLRGIRFAPRQHFGKFANFADFPSKSYCMLGLPDPGKSSKFWWFSGLRVASEALQRPGSVARSPQEPYTTFRDVWGRGAPSRPLRDPESAQIWPVYKKSPTITESTVDRLIRKFERILSAVKLIN